MIQLAIIEDNHQYRRVLEHIFASQEETRILHILENAEKINVAFNLAIPDIVIMDIDLPGKNGIDAVKELKIKYPELKILMLTVFEDAEKIFSAIKAGANGYLLKKDPPAKIIEAIYLLEKGETPINSIIAGKLLEYFQQKETKLNVSKDYNLTPRESEILHHLVNGHSYKEIASICNITFQTLNSHTKKIYQKLEVHSRSEAAAKFVKRK